MLIQQPQRRGGTLSEGLPHSTEVGFGPFGVVNTCDAVVAHLKDVLGDRLAYPVPGALVEIDFNPHPTSVTLRQKFVKL